MVSYLKSPEKDVFDIPHITFKLYSNIVVPSWVLDDGPFPKRWVADANFMLSKKVLMISMSSPSSFC